MRVLALAISLLVAASVAGCASSDGDPLSVCEQADLHLQECLGESGIDTESCDEQAAAAVLETDCESLSSDKADGFLSNLLCGVGLKCHCAPDAAGADDQLLDDDGADTAFGCGGPCRYSETGGFDGAGYHWALPHHGAHGTWRIPIKEPARYRLRAWMPVRDGAGTANYAVNTCSGFTRLEDVSQAVAEPGWVELGQFDLEPGAELRIGGGSGSHFLADALEVTRVP